jgi:hypothetical protein
MKRKILIFIAALALLILIFFPGKLRESFFPDRSDFSIPDTSKITSFTIIGEDTLNFQRLSSSWVVNDQYKVNPLAISNFFYLFKNISLKGLTLNPEIDEAASLKLNIRIGRRWKRMRFYPVKSTPMMHYEGSAKFYQIEVKGAEKADLNKIISSDINIWRDKLLFSYGINDLKSIKATPKEEWGKGFEILREGGKFLLKNQQAVLLDSSKYDADHLMMYAGYFGEVLFDSAFVLNPDNKEVLDKNLQFELNIESVKGEKQFIQIYSIENSDAQTDLLNAGCRIDLGDEIYVVPYVYLDPLMMSLEQFLVE